MLAGLLRRFALADATEQPDPAIPPFQGGMIGFLGYDLAPLIERLPRRPPRDSRLPDIRLALYDTAVMVDDRTGKVELWAWDLTGEGRAAAQRRGRAWRKALDRGVPVAATGIAPTASLGRSLKLVRPRDVSCDRCAGCWNTSRPATSSRSTCRSDSRPVERHEPLDLYLRLKAREPSPVRGVPPLERPGGRVGQPGVVLPDARRLSGHPADQGNPAAGLGPRRRRPARRRAARLAQGPRRADHDRRPRAQRPGPGLRVWLGRRSASRSRSNHSPRCTTWSPRSRAGCGRTPARST